MPGLTGADIRKRFEAAPDGGDAGGTPGGAAIRQAFETAQPMAQPQPEPEQDPLSGSYLGGKLPPAPSRVIGLDTPQGWERANILPLARNVDTGEIVPAIPSIIRDPIVGLTTQGPQIQNNALVVPGATINPQTGTFGLTPEAQAAGAAFGPSPLRFGGNALELQAPGLLERKAPLQIGQGNLLSPDAMARATERADRLEGTFKQVPGVAVTVPGGTPPTTTALSGQVIPPTNRAAATPTTSAEAKQVASQYYAIADRSNSSLTPQFTNRFIDNITAELPQTEAGKAVAGQSTVSSLVDRLQALRDKPMTLQAAQEVDEALGNLIDREYGPRGPTKEGVKLAGIQRSFRDQIENAGPGDVTGGSEGFDALGPARKAWSQAMKMADLERIKARSEMADVPTTSVKTQIRTLLNSATKSRGYSDEEIAALKDAAQRGVLGSALHVFGSRLIPIAAGAAELGTHGVTAGLAAGGAAHLVSSGLRNLETSLQSSRFQNAMKILGRSVPPPPGNALLPPP